jgi:RNA polymerase II-associated protein 1
MMRGQKFELNLDDDDESSGAGARLPGAFVSDIMERKSGTAAAPNPPTLKSKSGFPEHGKRTAQSRFKKRAISTQASSLEDQVSRVDIDSDKPKSWEEEEKERIDLENRERLAQMSVSEIEAQRQELMESLGPGLLQRLLQRSNIESGSGETDLTKETSTVQTQPTKPKKEKPKTVSFVELEPNDSNTSQIEVPKNINDNLEAPLAEDALPSIHFPKAPQPPDLDPSSKTFLQDLHEKYFPSLPSDPDKLEWMRPNQNGKDSYSPSATALNPKDLRFNFKGELIPPKTASEIPVTAGLHHHGDAPDAAGYTIAELAHLAHSSFAPQRCIAFQTLGRILYRLGKGEFGDTGEPGADTVGAEDTFGELARGLWTEMDAEQVVQMLISESEGKGVDGGRHVSAKAYATEAVWLWRKGGGRTWKAG